MIEDRLRELRIKAGLKQQDLLKSFKLSQGRYSQYETGKRKPDYDLLIEFADFYNVSLDYQSLIRIAILYDVTTDYLLGRTDDPTPPQTQKEKTPSEQEEVLRDLDGITPEMALEVRQYIGYLKHKNEVANAPGEKT